MHYSPDAKIDIVQAHSSVTTELQDLWLTLVVEVRPQLKVQSAQAYLIQGVCRRLKCVRRCLNNIFSLFPVSRQEILSEDERSDVEINLQAFLIHCHGVADNLAWTYVLERDIALKRREVGLFNSITQKVLPQDIRDYLASERMKTWHMTYAKNFRDALAHRIPPYIPPYKLTPEHLQRSAELDAEIEIEMRRRDFDRALELEDEKESLGRICPVFVHSYLDEDCSPPVLLHPQLIADARTVMEIVNKMRPHLPMSMESQPKRV